MLNKDLEKKDKLVKAYNVKEAATGRFGCRFFSYGYAISDDDNPKIR